jgi:hypothetical protein
MPLLLTLAIDMTPSIRAELRWETAGVAIGLVLLSIGLAARWSATDLGRPQDDDTTLLVLDFLPSP